ncbi:hypothetical protein Scep_001809 [Stephania cephalantha]|uniref:Uncharacterized protein n=1 Tax=Stephania cephalantha TaxID=152367 RepID=A0AAP0L8T3_9MAGN
MSFSRSKEAISSPKWFYGSAKMLQREITPLTIRIARVFDAFSSISILATIFGNGYRVNSTTLAPPTTGKMVKGLLDVLHCDILYILLLSLLSVIGRLAISRNTLNTFLAISRNTSSHDFINFSKNKSKVTFRKIVLLPIKNAHCEA